MNIDGRALAQDILARTRARAEKLSHRPKVVAYIASDPTPATRSYLNIKRKSAQAAGCDFEETKDATSFRDADAVIIQLPTTPEAMRMLNDLPAEKDADVLSRAAREKFEKGDTDALLPPVVGAIAEIFKTYGVATRGKKAAVVGAGFLVGEPAVVWLRQQGADVTVLNSKSKDPSAALRAADIIVSGAGSPRLIKPDMLTDGVVLVDAGTSESSGEIAGDADPACAHKCSLFTPVPGGVGPVAVACLFANAVTLAEQAN